jgi:hypothetical protein
MGLGRMTSINYSHGPAQKTNTRWLVHNWSTFCVTIHHGPDLGEASTFPLIVYYVPLHEAHIQVAFCPGTPKWESRNCQSWDS